MNTNSNLAAHYKRIQCPHCHTNLKAVGDYAARCACDTYPVIRNIIYVKKSEDGRHRRAVALLSEKKTLAAALLLLDNRRLANYLVVIPRIPLWIVLTVLSLIYPSGSLWWKYLRTRNRRATHILALSTICSLSKGMTVVDLGCGIGNFLDAASRWGRLRLGIGIDVSFFHLYVASLQLRANNVLFICADLSDSVPLVNSCADAAFCNDSFMYFPRRELVISELRRILTADGQAFLTHVHAKGFHNLGQGRGSDPQHIQTLAGGSFSVGALSDQSFFTYIRTHKPIVYGAARSAGAMYKSYSYRLSKKGVPQKPISLSGAFNRHVSSTRIDFFEDTELIPDHTRS